MQALPYLNFGGRCEEAINFYKRALGAEVTELLRFKDGPKGPGCGEMPAGIENKIMHSSLRMGESTIMATDGECRAQGGIQGFSLALSPKNDSDAERFFAALSDGGKVTMPLSKTFFASNFGMVTDRFGVSWMVVVTPENPK
jgi:PhnB protein